MHLNKKCNCPKCRALRKQNLKETKQILLELTDVKKRLKEKNIILNNPVIIDEKPYFIRGV